MIKTKPQFIIAGTGSGVGKTSISLGITAALNARNCNVQTFKTGPDYLDPTYLKLASGQTCYNLDSWMCSAGYLKALYSRQTDSADVAIVEGVMGLFDGADPCTLSGSTAEISTILNIPIVLVVNAHGCARSLAATVKGFCELEPTVEIAGVIANHVGSERHVEWLRSALAHENLPPLVGAVPRRSLPTIPSRHLGLKTAEHHCVNSEFLHRLTEACEQYIELDRLLDICNCSYHSPAKPPRSTSQSPIRIAIARDQAFHFTYPDNLQLLEAYGAELCYFSPLNDRHLPENISGLYLPGGYPELFAEQLSRNSEMLTAVKAFASLNNPIYAECGGLMYLGESIHSQGQTVPLCGILPIQTTMLDKRNMLGYTEITLQHDCILGHRGDLIRGHEFHYSAICADNTSGWTKPYSVTRRRSSKPLLQGFCRGNILASYVHLHWGSTPQVAEHFVNRCKGVKK